METKPQISSKEPDKACEAENSSSHPKFVEIKVTYDKWVKVKSAVGRAKKKYQDLAKTVLMLNNIKEEQTRSADLLRLENERLHQRIKELELADVNAQGAIITCIKLNKMENDALEQKNQNLKAETEALQTNLKESERNRIEEQVNFTSKLDEQSQTIETLNSEISQLTKDIESLQNQLEESKKDINQQQKLLKKLKMEHSRDMKIHEQKMQELDMLKSQHTVVKEELEHSKTLLVSHQTQAKQVNTRCQQQQMFTRRFKEDLQSCIAVMTEPKDLKQKLLDLKSRYLEDAKPLACSENPEKEYKEKIMDLEKKMESSRQTVQNEANMRQRLQKKYSECLKAFHKKERQYIEILTLQKSKVKNLEEELKEKDLQLQHLKSEVEDDST